MQQVSSDFKVSTGKPTLRNDQETIITYDKESDSWHFYSDNPVHCRKYEHLIVPSDTYPSSKVHHEETGQLIRLDGKIEGSVSISKKRKMTDEQKELASQRMKALHEQNAI